MQHIIVGTADGLHKVGNGRAVELDGRDVTALAKGDSEWWAVVDGHQVWRAHGDGEWAELGSVGPLRANCLLPTSDGLFVGTSESHLYKLNGETLERVDAFDRVEDRDAWHTPWGGPPDVRSMSAGPDGAVYANVHVGGIPRSADGGASWQPTIEIGSDVHQVQFDAGSGLLLAACARGLAVSDDGGRSWRFDRKGAHGSYMRAVAVAGDTVIATASSGPYTDRGAVYRRPVDSDGAFEKCEAGLPEWFPGNVDTYCVAASDSLAALGASDGSVYTSSDQGATWSLAAEGLPQVRCVALG